MMQDEIKRKLSELEKRIIVLEGGEVKVPPVKKKHKVVETKPKPQIGTTTNPFGAPGTTAQMPSLIKEEDAPKVTTTENIVKIEQDNDQSPLISKEEDVLTPAKFTKKESEALDKSVAQDRESSLDIDPLDIHLQDEKLKEKYGDRYEEAVKMLKELKK